MTAPEHGGAAHEKVVNSIEHLFIECTFGTRSHERLWPRFPTGLIDGAIAVSHVVLYRHQPSRANDGRKVTG